MAEMFTREKYMLIRAVLAGSSIWLAREAVATTALAHPEWDMEERRTWRDWERSERDR